MAYSQFFSDTKGRHLSVVHSQKFFLYLGLTIPRIDFMRVVFPEPFGPIRETTCPFSNVAEILSSTCSLRNRLLYVFYPDHNFSDFMSGLSSNKFSGVRLGMALSALSNSCTVKLLNNINAWGFCSTIMEYMLTG